MVSNKDSERTFASILLSDDNVNDCRSSSSEAPAGIFFKKRSKNEAEADEKL